jgi:hypothetical protein
MTRIPVTTANGDTGPPTVEYPVESGLEVVFGDLLTFRDVRQQLTACSAPTSTSPSAKVSSKLSHLMSSAICLIFVSFLRQLGANNLRSGRSPIKPGGGSATFCHSDVASTSVSSGPQRYVTREHLWIGGAPKARR